MSAHLMPPRPDLTREEYVTRAIYGLSIILIKEFYASPDAYVCDGGSPSGRLATDAENGTLCAREVAEWFCEHPFNKAEIQQFMEVNDLDVHFAGGGVVPLAACLADNEIFVAAVESAFKGQPS
ncbi:hypothetical protein Sa4125_30340 [Aureimonas sp. SA4125]|uniref:hypothetical protein n=1 Tax=Aureimonas sp. SA4125 TaxID=2826993 RepID=UPI001CC3E345|nr:hypothetical protein [Aureimonas sp. SA4125]BDA85492.1 hypothetical protein Sa4125_30340 [Aureimonas sp. SA4125]